jgi:hypothetical protein
MEEVCMNDDSEKAPEGATVEAPASAPAPAVAQTTTAPDPSDKVVKFALGVGKELGMNLAAQASRKLSSTHVELLCAGLNSAGFRNVSQRIRRFRTYGN